MSGDYAYRLWRVPIPRWAGDLLYDLGRVPRRDLVLVFTVGVTTGLVLAAGALIFGAVVLYS